MSAQQDLFSAPPFGPVQRVPAQELNQESVLAAIEVAPKVNKQQATLLAWLCSNGPALDEELVRSGLHPNAVRARRVELVRKGLVVRAGTGRTRSGRSAATWRAV